MAVIFPGKTRCRLCGETIHPEDETVAFPAFLPPTHELSFFSDAPFHRACFELDLRAAHVRELHARYREIWDSRPPNLKSLVEIEAWGREAFKNFP